MSKEAKELCSGVHTLHDETLELAESVLFMAKKLSEAREQMKEEALVIEYDNGGGQSGIRENPHYTAYEHLLATYSKSLRQLADILKDGSQSSRSSGIMKELAVISGKKIG